MVRLVKALVVCAMVLGLATPAFSIFGLGVHYSFDYSVTMPDKLNDPIQFTGLSMDTSVGFTSMPTGFPGSFSALDLPIFIDRAGWKASPINFGGKVYVDILPVIDAIEIGANFGVWEYEGKIRYPNSITVTSPTIPSGVTSLIEMQSQSLVNITYDTLDLSLDKNGISFLGLSKTPYAKLQLEINLRKYIKLPVVGAVIKPYIGAGANCNLATPAISSGLVVDAIGDKLNSPMNMTGITGVLADTDNQKAIMEEIISRMMTPHFGAQIMLGTIIKPPVIPFGIYVDGKYIIPFENYDKYAEVKGMGLLLNAGIVLHI